MALALDPAALTLDPAALALDPAAFTLDPAALTLDPEALALDPLPVLDPAAFGPSPLFRKKLLMVPGGKR